LREFGQDFKQYFADELFQVATEEGICEEDGASAGTAGTASECGAFEQPGGGAPVVPASAGDVCSGMGVELEVGFLYPLGELKVVLGGLLNGARGHTKQPGGLAFGEAVADELVKEDAFFFVENEGRTAARGGSVGVWLSGV
jgi:hypothetical protein